MTTFMGGATWFPLLTLLIGPSLHVPVPPLSMDDAVLLNVDAVKLNKLARAHSDVWAHAVSGERQELEQHHALLNWRHGDLSPLRVAIVSSQLGDTVQGRGLAALLAAQPRPAWFHLTLISTGRPAAAGTAAAAVVQQLQSRADAFENAHGWPAHQLATYLLQHAVHVSIHLDEAYAPALQQGVLQLRPTPVQVTWASLWPAPAGSSLVSYLACSHNGCAPRPLRKILVERPALLSPDVAFWWLQKAAEAADEDASVAKLRRSMGLPAANGSEKHFAFCSPVGADRLDAASAAAWLDILERAPSAHLVLPPPSSTGGESGKWMASAAKARKVNKRVHVWKNMPPQAWGPASAVCHAVLAPLSRSTEQTLEAIAAGIPVIALGDATLAARQLVGFLHDVGLEDGVVQVWAGDTRGRLIDVCDRLIVVLTT